jgi:hypothetical protein
MVLLCRAGGIALRTHGVLRIRLHMYVCIGDSNYYSNDAVRVCARAAPTSAPTNVGDTNPPTRLPTALPTFATLAPTLSPTFRGGAR